MKLPYQLDAPGVINDATLFADLRLRDEIDDGHWSGQEQPDWVNARITGFPALTGC